MPAVISPVAYLPQKKNKKKKKRKKEKRKRKKKHSYLDMLAR